MNSSKAIKGLMIGISVLLRLAILAYPGLMAVIIGGYTMQEEYTPYIDLCFFIIYLIIVIMDLFILVIVPCFHNKISMAIIIGIDVVSLIANTIFAIFSSFHWESSTIAAISIPGTLYHVIILIILMIWSGIPILKNKNGISSFFKPKEFYYGCLFVKKNSEINCLDDDKSIEIDQMKKQYCS